MMIDPRVRRMRRTIWPMLRAAIQLFLFVAITNGAPLVDAAFFHAGSAHTGARHIESADGPACHGERCVVGVGTIAPPPADGPAVQLRVEAPLRRAVVLPSHDRPFNRIDASPLGSRAPPA